MPTYVILMNLTEQGVKNIKDAPARIEEATKAIEAAGGKLISFYLTMGQYDYVAISEGPSESRPDAVARTGRSRQCQDDDAEGVHEGGIRGDSEKVALALLARTTSG